MYMFGVTFDRQSCNAAPHRTSPDRSSVSQRSSFSARMDRTAAGCASRAGRSKPLGRTRRRSSRLIHEPVVEHGSTALLWAVLPGRHRSIRSLGAAGSSSWMSLPIAFAPSAPGTLRSADGASWYHRSCRSYQNAVGFSLAEELTRCHPRCSAHCWRPTEAHWPSRSTRSARAPGRQRQARGRSPRSCPSAGASSSSVAFSVSMSAITWPASTLSPTATCHAATAPNSIS